MMSYYRDSRDSRDTRDSRNRRPERPDIPEEDRYGSGSGQSYRPGRRSPAPSIGTVRSHDYRSERSPPPRDGDRPYMNSYHPPPRPRSPPPTYRPRPRSPVYRSRDDDDGYRPRPISPARRQYRRDDPPRADSYRNERDDPRYRPAAAERPVPSRFPVDTSYVPQKRSRDVSPISSRGRASPVAKRGRPSSPPRRYENNYRPISPDRIRRVADRPLPPQPVAQSTDSFRRRSRSPEPWPQRDELPPRVEPVRRQEPWRVDEAQRRREAPASSLPQSRTDSQPQSTNASRHSSPPVHPSRMAKVLTDNRAGVPQSASEWGVSSGRPRSPVQHPQRQDPSNVDEQSRERMGPSDESPTVTRPTPIGPGGTRQPSLQQPSGAARDRDVDPAWNSYRPQREDSRSGDIPPARPTRGSYSGPPPREPASMSGPPTGPRNGGVPGGAPRGPASSQPMRSQRFGSSTPANTTAQYLAGLPQIIDGGRKLPPTYDRSRLDKLEDEYERLRKVVDGKQSSRRKGMREWERLQRESEAAGYRAELADEAVRSMAGEVMTSSAAF